VVRRKHSWLVSRRRAMPMLPRRRYEISEPVEADIPAAGPSLAPAAAGRPQPKPRFGWAAGPASCRQTAQSRRRQWLQAAWTSARDPARPSPAIASARRSPTAARAPVGLATGSRWERQGFPWLPSPAQPGRHDESLVAARAPCAGEAEAEEPTLEIAAEFVLDIARHGPFESFPPLEPALEVLGDDLVERRLLGATPLVTP
jgi:hypothetical protein